MRNFIFFLILSFKALTFSAQSSIQLPEDREKKILDWVDYGYNAYKLNVIKSFTGIDFTYERRVNINFSLTGTIDWRARKNIQSVLLMPGVRYYYNLEKRILNNAEKKQQKTSCISADYFEFDFQLGSGYGKDYNEEGRRGYNGGYFGPLLRAGRQRIFWKYFYYDIWLGYEAIYPGYGTKYVTTNTIGFGLSAIQQKKIIGNGLRLAGALGVFLLR